jgi:hypothetical protein
MTLALLNDLISKNSFEGNDQSVSKARSERKEMVVESDWSSAS